MTERQYKTITKKLHFYNQGGIKNLCTMTETTLRQVMEEAAGVTQAYIRKLVQHDIDQQNKIALLSAKVYKLQKENAKVEEIKANADYQLEGRDLEIMEQKEQLTKAKEIIHKVCYEYGIYDKDLMEEAKQFLQKDKTEQEEPYYVIVNMNCQYEICRKCPKSGLFKGTYEECEKWIKEKLRKAEK